MRTPASSTLFLACILGCVAEPVLAQGESPEYTVWLKSDPAGADRFGLVLDVSGDVAIVGAPRDNDPLFGVGEYGAAYVYRNSDSGWVEEMKFEEDDRQFYAWFGQAVAIDDDVALVSVRNDAETDDGAVSVYRYDGNMWAPETTLVCADRERGDGCGRSVDLDGTIAVLGSPADVEDGIRSGSARVFRYDGAEWVEEATLLPDDPVHSLHFGESVAVHGHRILVGAWGVSSDDDSHPVGSAYVFEQDSTGWVRTAVLESDETNRLSQFGLRVGLYDDLAVIGAPLDDENGGGAGAAFLYRFDGVEWIEVDKILAHDPTGFNMFGSSVAIDRERIVVGAPNWGPPNETSNGKAYVYEYAQDGTLQHIADLVPETDGTGDEFGTAVAVAGETVLIGSPSHDVPMPGVGTVYAYVSPRSSVAVERPTRQIGVRLSAAYPNPFVSSARLRLELDRPERVRITLFDLLGREIRVLHEGVVPAREPMDFEVHAEGLPAGIYLIRATTAGLAVTRTVTLIR